MGQEATLSQDEFPKIVEEHTNYVYNVALRMTNNPHDAEDITQEVFLSAYKSFSSFRGQSQVTTWLYRITVNACLMKIRKEKKAKQLTQTGYDDTEVPDWGGDPAKAAVNTELREALQDGISRLEPSLRSAVVLRDIQGFSGEESAEILGVTLASLKSRLHRGRVILRKHLETLVARPA